MSDITQWYESYNNNYKDITDIKGSRSQSRFFGPFILLTILSKSRQVTLRLVATLNFLSMKCPDFSRKGSLYHLEMENVKKMGGSRATFFITDF